MTETVADPRKGAPVPVLATPTARSIAAHLREHHRPFPQHVLDGALTKDHLAWHRAEHQYRTPSTRDGVEKGRHAGHLGHTHPDPAAKAAKGKAA